MIHFVLALAFYSDRPPHFLQVTADGMEWAGGASFMTTEFRLSHTPSSAMFAASMRVAIAQEQLFSLDVITMTTSGWGLRQSPGMHEWVLLNLLSQKIGNSIHSRKAHEARG